MQSNFNQPHSILRKFSWNMLEKYSERAHEHYDMDPLYKAVKIGFSNLRQDEIQTFLKQEKEKAKTPYIKKDFQKIINMFNR